MAKKTKVPEKLQKEVVEKILREFQKGNVCFITVDGINIQPLEWFAQQPLEGMLHDMNRNKKMIEGSIEDSKWVNDMCLTTILEYYYKRCQELEGQLKPKLNYNEVREVARMQRLITKYENVISALFIKAKTGTEIKLLQFEEQDMKEEICYLWKWIKEHNDNK